MTHWTDRLFQEQADLFAQTLERRFEKGHEDASTLLSFLEERGHGPDSVLDVACGTGRHVLGFADEGLRAEGLDYSEAFVERARERAEEAGLADRTDFAVEDMRELDQRDGEYDLVTVFWNSLGYYDRETDRTVLADARELLSAEGTLAVGVTNKELTVREFQESAVREREGEMLAERREFDLETGRLHTTVDRFSPTESGYDHVATTEFKPRLYSPVELKELCLDAGFESVDLYGGFGGEELTFESPRVLVLAE